MLRNNTLSNLSDEDLLSMHKESDKNDCIEELFIRYLPLLYGVCLKYLKDADKACETLSQLYEELFETLANYDIDEFRPWIYGVVKNHCFQTLRKEEHSIAVDFNEDIEEFTDILDIFEKDKNASSLTECINKLPERQRTSLNYFFTNELSYAEIVNKTGYTLKNVKTYIRSGKQNLKLCLENNNP